MTTSIVSATDFINDLNTHDWLYYMGSGPAYIEGYANWRRLCAVAKENGLMPVLEAMADYKGGKREMPDPTEFEHPVITTVAIDTVAANDGTCDPDPTPVEMDFTRENVSALVGNGLIFGCQFVKRTTGELRNMQARVAVKKHLKGGTAAYSAADKNLLSVYDMANKGYRSIPIERITRLTANGVTYIRQTALNLAA